jgi:hypothetical protein
MTQKTCFVILFLVFICNPVVNANSNYQAIAIKLETLFNKMAISEDDAEKSSLNDTIDAIIQEYIKTDSVFYHRFNNTKFLGQITSPDSLVKILTWNVAYSDRAQNYNCYLLYRGNKNDEIRSYKLITISGADKIRTDTVYSQKNWYGSLYYDIRPFFINSEKYYILLGIDFKDAFLTRKVIEIVQFAEGNNLLFGELCFADQDKMRYREVFNYSSRAAMTLRFDLDDLIVFDHLSPFSPEYKDNFQYYGPDFSYDAYSLENGQWKLKQDIDVRNK